MKTLFLFLALLYCSLSFSQITVTSNQCVNTQNVQITPTITGANQFQWSVTPTIPFTGQGTSSISIPDVGSTLQAYTFTLIASDNGQCSDTAIIVINVIGGQLSVNNPPSICVNNGILDLTQYINPNTGLSFVGTGVNSIGQFNPSTLTPGTYNIQVSATIGTCVVNGTIAVTVDPGVVITNVIVTP